MEHSSAAHNGDLREMRRWLPALLLAVALAGTGLGTAAQSSLPVERLTDLFEDSPIATSPLHVLRLDPTGERVAWLTRGDQYAVLELSTGEARLVPLPEEMSPVTEFTWSPDGHRIAMTENVFLYLYESDVWVSDIQSGMTRDCTDDLYFGGLLRAPADAWLDLFPAWRSPTDLAFLRASDGDLQGAVELRSISTEACGMPGGRVDANASQLLWSLPEGFPAMTHVVAAPSWSPDGEKVAIMTQGPPLRDPTDGLWILDASTGATTAFVSAAELSKGFPDWYDTTVVAPQDLAWLDGGTHIVVFAQDRNPAAPWPGMNLFLVDATSGEVAPVADYHGYADQASFYRPGEDGHTGIFEVPLQAAVLPDGSGIVTVHQEPETDEVELRMLRLRDGDFTVEAKSVLSAAPYARGRGPSIIRVTDQGRALLLNRYIVQLGGVAEDAAAPD